MPDNPDYRKYLEEKFEGMAKHMNAQFDAVHDKLDAIEKQTTKTNGRVTELESKVVDVEKDILTHPINCNQAAEIKEIRKDLEEYRMLKKYPKVGILIILVAALFAWYGFRQLNNRIEKQGIPVITNSRGQLMPLPDSTKILWLYNDSAKFMIKRVK
jgi:hypothetical protein